MYAVRYVYYSYTTHTHTHYIIWLRSLRSWHFIHCKFSKEKDFMFSYLKMDPNFILFCKMRNIGMLIITKHFDLYREVNSNELKIFKALNVSPSVSEKIFSNFIFEWFFDPVSYLICVPGHSVKWSRTRPTTATMLNTGIY